MIKDKDQLATIDKLTKQKIKVIDSDNAVCYLKNKLIYCFDKSIDINDNRYLKIDNKLITKYITVDNKNRIHCFDKQPIKEFSRNVFYKTYYEHGERMFSVVIYN